MEDSDEFDEFLFESIKRYNTLQMFNLENVPHHLVQLNDLSICVVNKRVKGNNSELLRLQLPKKLLLPPDEEGRSKENDFKVLSGVYTESGVHSLGKLYPSNKIITSEFDVTGLKVYDLMEDHSVSDKQGECINIVPWRNPNLVTLISTNSVLCSKSIKDPLLLVDIEGKKIIKEIVHIKMNESASECSERNIKCEVFQNGLVILLDSQSGDLILHDLKSDRVVKNISGNNKQNTQELWNISSHDFCHTQMNYFGIVSSNNGFVVFDMRNLDGAFKKLESDKFSQCIDVHKLKLKFSQGEDKFSISGLNANVNIFSLNRENFSHLFTHNGHSPGHSSSAMVTDHIWLTMGNKELVVSVCDNKTLNCWEFNKNA